MDFQHAKQYLTVLYKEINGYGISAQARSRISVLNKGYTYGEIVPESFLDMMNFVNPKKGEVFYDLGSGTGKAVILASFLFDFSRCIGVEILKELYQTSLQVLNRYNTEIQLNHQYGSVAEFINANFLDYDFSDGDIFFMHSTCFDDHLMIDISRKLEQVRKNTRVITVTKTLDSPSFSLLKTHAYYMGWGKASINFYQKIL